MVLLETEDTMPHCSDMRACTSNTANKPLEQPKLPCMSFALLFGGSMGYAVGAGSMSPHVGQEALDDL